MALAPSHQRSPVLEKPRDAEWVKISVVCYFSILEFDPYKKTLFSVLL